ncbi:MULTISPECIES: hypothetical protein [unclassified Motilimonas]|uniref:hypothetical protein n=1 Tax=Motilimonas TaxID=1914248 RepID=UPI001E5CB0EB|nr:MULTISPECIES: hypothetical protein [unclassified Motilimonas]MCE0558251.1 hypothetical protein [Motilimonas sp. E26]MDO6526431.1 hypothetical protein [Motilimonas sp. 1_MG-2023]
MKSYFQTIRSQAGANAPVNGFPAVLRAFILVSFFLLALPLLFILLALQLVIGVGLFIAAMVMKNRQHHQAESWSNGEKVINPL